MQPQGRVLMVAVDGVLAESLEARRDALRDAALDTGLLRSSPDIAPLSLAGMDWNDMVHMLHMLPLMYGPHTHGATSDHTLRDLTVFAAERLWTARLASGLPVLVPTAISRCRTAATNGFSVVLRSDSTRRSAQRLFEVLEAETLAVRTLAADDPAARTGVGVLRDRQLAAAFQGRSAARLVEPDPTPVLESLPHGVAITVGWPSIAL